MLWLSVTCLLTLVSGFPFRTFGDRDNFGIYQVQGVDYARLSHPKHFVCDYSPFFGGGCFPPVFLFLTPLQSLSHGQQSCISIPSTTACIINFSSSSHATGGRKFSETVKEIIKEVEAEAEKERLPDNTNIEVNGEEVEPENFVKKENGVETKESKVGTKNKIIRLSEEIIEVSEENQSPEKMLLYKNFQDENMSVSSNLV